MTTTGEHDPAPTPSRKDGQAGPAAPRTLPRNREATSPVDEERTVGPSAPSAASIVETPDRPAGFLGAGELGDNGLPEVPRSEIALGTRRYATDSLKPFKPFETGEIPVGELQRQARAWRWQRLAAVGLGSALGVALVVAFFAVLGLLVR